MEWVKVGSPRRLSRPYRRRWLSAWIGSAPVQTHETPRETRRHVMTWIQSQSSDCNTEKLQIRTLLLLLRLLQLLYEWLTLYQETESQSSLTGKKTFWAVPPIQPTILTHRTPATSVKIKNDSMRTTTRGVVSSYTAISVHWQQIAPDWTRAVTAPDTTLAVTVT